jgi:hypothetical protein
MDTLKKVPLLRVICVAFKVAEVQAYLTGQPPMEIFLEAGLHLHTYNTGIHNLRGETMPDVLPGRKLDDLWAYALATSGFPATRALCGSDGFGPPVDRC